MASFILVVTLLTLIVSLVFKFRNLSLITFFLSLVILFILCTGILPSFLLSGLQKYSYNQDQLPFKNTNVIVLLGGGVADVSKSVLLPSLLTYSRINAAAQAYFLCKKNQAHCVIITSGGDIKQINDSDAHVYKIALVSLGVNPADIQSESKSRSTYENVKFSEKLIRSGHYEQVFLVTSGIHVKRALITFKHFGISAIPVPADYMQARNSIFALGYNLFLTDAALHEYIGIMKYRLSDFNSN